MNASATLLAVSERTGTSRNKEITASFLSLLLWQCGLLVASQGEMQSFVPRLETFPPLSCKKTATALAAQ